MLAVDPGNQTFDAIVTGNHRLGESIRPAVWPAPILREGDDLAFEYPRGRVAQSWVGYDRGGPDVSRIWLLCAPVPPHGGKSLPGAGALPHRGVQVFGR